MVKAIIFDFGGVISNSGTLKPVYQYCPDSSKKSYDETKKFVRLLWNETKITLESESFWQGLAEYCNEDIEIIKTNCLKLIGLNDKIISLIHNLKNKYTVALLSNHISSWLGDIIEEEGWDQLFDLIVTSYGAGFAKPQPEIYQITLDRLQLKGEECVFIDDKESNIAAARNFGIKGVVFENYEQLLKELELLDVDLL